uniref:Uncharacterized protein n=1 Tax=Romanomermis culicivorax TaxID=13658 RepID=A0A915JQX2_ROMCU
MDISKFLLTLVMISRLLMNSKLQPSVASHSSQPDFNIYVPNEVTLQLSRLNYKGTLCRRSLPSRVYCLQACLRDCVGLGNELAMFKMRCLLGRKKSSTRSLRMENHLTCKCYYSQRKKVHKNRGKKCLASTNSWDNVQDFFLKSYMNRTGETLHVTAIC